MMQVFVYTCYTEPIIDSQEGAKIVERDPAYQFIKFPLKVTSHIRTVQYQNPEIHIGAMNVYSSVPFYQV